IAATLQFVGVQRAESAPITLSFDATIHTVFPGIPFDSGVNFAVDDIIHGRFTFEPQTSPGDMYLLATQAYELAIDVNGTELTTQGFQLESVNNSPISEFTPVNEVDVLVLGAGELSPINPAE